MMEDVMLYFFLQIFNKLTLKIPLPWVWVIFQKHRKKCLGSFPWSWQPQSIKIKHIQNNLIWDFFLILWNHMSFNSISGRVQLMLWKFRKYKLNMMPNATMNYRSFWLNVWSWLVGIPIDMFDKCLFSKWLNY